jgi:hypothetical protein
MGLPIAHAEKECQLESRALFGGDQAMLVEGFTYFARKIARRVRLLEYRKSPLACLAQ